MAKNNSIYQIALIAVAALAVLGLYFFGKTTKPLTLEQAAQSVATQKEEITLDTQELIAQATKELSQQETLQLNGTAEPALPEFWKSIDRNDIAAIYSQQLAEQKGDFERWNNTGDLFVRAFREVEDTTQRIFFVQEAISSYQNALDFQQDVDAKLKLAKIHTSITGEAMQGVLLLREIIEQEPKHIQANYELGLLSLQSGQTDKAMARFDLLIKEEPKFIEPYILKAQILLGDEKKQEAINVIDVAMVNTANPNGLAVLQEMKNRIK